MKNAIKHIAPCLILYLGLLGTSSYSVQAQSKLLKHVEIGVSLNYSNMHFNSDLDMQNDFYSYDYGFQAHALVNLKISPRISAQSGLEYIYYIWHFDDQIIPHTRPDGPAYTMDYTKLSMSKDFHVSYLAVPVRFRYYPLPRQPLYVIAGADISHRIGYSNGILEMAVYSEDGAVIYGPESYDYDIPEMANDVLLSGMLGAGVQVPKSPVAFEIKAKHSITNFIGNDVDNNWLRSLAISVSYTL